MGAFTVQANAFSRALRYNHMVVMIARNRKSEASKPAAHTFKFEGTFIFEERRSSQVKQSLSHVFLI